MNAPPSLLWLRNDLRLQDNPALAAAWKRRAPVLAVYLFEDEEGGARRPGDAARLWLKKSLPLFAKSLAAHNVPLLVARGRAENILPAIAKTIGAGAIFFNRRICQDGRRADEAAQKKLTRGGVQIFISAANTLLPPDSLKPKTGGAQSYKVFTPFWRAMQKRRAEIQPEKLPRPSPPPHAADFLNKLRAGGFAEGLDHKQWKKWPEFSPAENLFPDSFTPGEAAARRRLAAFLRQDLKHYAARRDHPAAASATSVLSAHLRFGEIGARDIAASLPAGTYGDAFLRQLAWRDFCMHLLFHFPALPRQNFNPAFNFFRWEKSAAHLDAWRRGQTGYPFIDAAMRELAQTGLMHNRARMAAASFLTKHLLIHWREGEAWFWRALLDGDEANNPANWQWCAGSGADAAPYFRIFNPILQGKKFDAGGDYIRRFVPELARLPNAHLYAPHLAPAAILAAAGVRLGQNYPAPIVDHAAARAEALRRYAEMKQAAASFKDN